MQDNLWDIAGTSLSKQVGGCTVHNAMVWIRPTADDINSWNVTGWSFNDLLPYMKKSENSLGNSPKDPNLHGFNGPIGISDESNSEKSQYDGDFLQSCLNMGYQRNYDFNGQTREGCGYFPHSVKNGVRESAATGYIAPILNKRNFKLFTQSTVTKILIEITRKDGPVAKGVEYVDVRGIKRTVYAKKEVILAAGTFSFISNALPEMFLFELFNNILSLI